MNQDHYTLLVTLPENDHGSEALFLQMLLSQAKLPKLTTITTSSRVAVGEILERGGIDLLLLASFDQDGLDAVRWLAVAHPEVPVVVLTDSLNSELCWQAVEAGAQDCLRRVELTGPALGRAIGFAVERQRNATAVRRLGRYDPLTGLLNNGALLALLQRLFERHRSQPDCGFSVFVTEIQNYDAVGRRYGQLCADEMLIALSRRLEQTARPSDIAARFNGHSFALVLPSVSERRHAEAVAERVRNAMVEPVEVRRRVLGAVLRWAVTSSRDGFEDSHDMLGATVLDLKCA